MQPGKHISKKELCQATICGYQIRLLERLKVVSLTSIERLKG